MTRNNSELAPEHQHRSREQAGLIKSLHYRSQYIYILFVPTQITAVTASSVRPGCREQVELICIRSSRIPETLSWTSVRWFPWRPTAAGRRAGKKP